MKCHFIRIKSVLLIERDGNEPHSAWMKFQITGEYNEWFGRVKRARVHCTQSAWHKILISPPFNGSPKAHFLEMIKHQKYPKTGSIWPNGGNVYIYRSYGVSGPLSPTYTHRVYTHTHTKRNFAGSSSNLNSFSDFKV